eukprot:768230-Hanusia_phi.AAC.4
MTTVSARLNSSQDITGANVLSSFLLNVSEDDLGLFGKLVEVRTNIEMICILYDNGQLNISGRRCILLTKSPSNSQSPKQFCTVLLCCSEESTMSEMSNVLHNALRCLNDLLVNEFAVAGAGCFEVKSRRRREVMGAGGGKGSECVGGEGIREGKLTDFSDSSRPEATVHQRSRFASGFFSRSSCGGKEKKMIFRAIGEILDRLATLPGYLDSDNFQLACERLREANQPSLNEQKRRMHDALNDEDQALFGWNPIRMETFPVWMERCKSSGVVIAWLQYLFIAHMSPGFVLDDGFDKRRALQSALQMAMDCLQKQIGLIEAVLAEWIRAVDFSQKKGKNKVIGKLDQVEALYSAGPKEMQVKE